MPRRGDVRLRPRLLFLLLVFVIQIPLAGAAAPPPPELVIESKNPVSYDPDAGVAIATNGVIVKYGNMVMTADKATWMEKTQDILGEGAVRIEKDNATYVGERLNYNYTTQLVSGDHFRGGRRPTFVEGASLEGNRTNGVYTVHDGFMTADDYDQPTIKIHAESFKIIPGDRF